MTDSLINHLINIMRSEGEKMISTNECIEEIKNYPFKTINTLEEMGFKVDITEYLKSHNGTKVD